MAQAWSKADHARDERQRRRVADFIGDPEAIEGMTAAEITLAVRLAIRAMVTFIVEEDVNGSRLN